MKHVTIRILLTIVVMKGWPFRQLDVDNAFLHGLLHEKVYIEQPSRFEVTGSQPLVFHLKNALYGLRQSPRAWYERLSSCLHGPRFITSQVDTFLLFHVTPNACCYVFIYVDDLIIMESSPTELDDLICSLNYSTFAFKDLDKLSYFFGVKVSYLETGGLFLSQSKYISDLLHQTKMSEAKSITTPMVSGLILSAHQGEFL